MKIWFNGEVLEVAAEENLGELLARMEKERKELDFGGHGICILNKRICSIPQNVVLTEGDRVDFMSWPEGG